MKTAQSGRFWRLSAVTACLLLFVAACYPYPDPVNVPFPSDARVLDGEWLMDIRLAQPGARTFLHLPEEQLLLTWDFENRVRAWSDWLETDATPWAHARAGNYDPAINAFIAFRSGGLTVIPATGGAGTQVDLVLPEGLAVLSRAVGSGRVFVYGRTAAGGNVLYWWDTLTGTYGGSQIITGAPDGMEVSANGRLLSFWNLRGGTAQVIDTTTPGQPIRLRLGACRMSHLHEASHDGRWFVLNGCNDRISVFDLHDPGGGATNPVIRAAGPVRFSDDSAELLWIDLTGKVSAYDPVSRQTAILYTLPEDERTDWSYWYDFSLHRATGQLSVLANRGQVLVQELPGTARIAELPPPVTDTASMRLTATNATSQEPRSSTYEVTGTVMIPGLFGPSADFSVSGSVYSYGLHRFQPAGISSQASPPPSTDGRLELTPLSGPETESLMLDFTTQEVTATWYTGRIQYQDRLEYFDVKLYRPD